MSSLADFAEPRPVRYADLGGIETVLADIRELVERPLRHPEVQISRHSPHYPVPEAARLNCIAALHCKHWQAIQSLWHPHAFKACSSPRGSGVAKSLVARFSDATVRTCVNGLPGVCVAGGGATAGGPAAWSPRLWQDGPRERHSKRVRRSLPAHICSGDCGGGVW
jgi:hypothetical protein